MSQDSSASDAPDTKRPWRSRMRIFLLSSFAISLVRVLGLMLRSVRFPENEHQAMRDIGNSGALIALWHGSHFSVLWAFRHRGIGVLTSRSRDGEILSRVLTHFGFQCFRGSSSRGGGRALIETARAIQGGLKVAIAVDGPRGPRWEVKPGILTLAKLSGVPIYPLVGSLSRYVEFRSWDRFRLPKPGSHLLSLLGEPIRVPPDADDAQIEALRVKLQNELVALQKKADELAISLHSSRASSPRSEQA